MSETAKIFGFILIVCNSWVYAVCCVLNRALKTVHPAVVMFWHGVCGLSIAITVILVEHCFFTDNTEVRVLHYEAKTYGYLIGAMLFDSLGTYASTIAF